MTLRTTVDWFQLVSNDLLLMWASLGHLHDPKPLIKMKTTKKGLLMPIALQRTLIAKAMSRIWPVCMPATSTHTNTLNLAHTHDCIHTHKPYTYTVYVSYIQYKVHTVYTVHCIYVRYTVHITDTHITNIYDSFRSFKLKHSFPNYSKIDSHVVTIQFTIIVAS